MTEAQLHELVDRARGGDDRAWEEIVERFRGLVAAITRGFRLSSSDAADVAQTTWLRLFESIHRVRDPERLAAWIGTTARRECLRVLRSASRELPTDQVDRGEPTPCYEIPGQQLLSAEPAAAVRTAVAGLPDRHRRLLAALFTTPRPSYATVAERLDMPVGSIGPTRQRAVERLQRDPRVLALAS
jgi:RNA polymerase sigma factor (sigma-70 family)